MGGDDSRVLSDKDVQVLAEKLMNVVHEQKHDFWIDPESHYRDHARWSGFDDDQIRTMHDLITTYKNARNLFWKAFLGLAIIGSIVAAAVGLGFK